MSKPWIIGIALIAALLGAAVYFRHDARPMTPAAYSGPVDKIVIANIGLYSIFNIVALEKGFFRENGLDARIDEYDSGHTSVAALLSGKADFAIAADFVGVQTIFTDERLTILSKVSDHDVFHLVARKDRGISGPADIQGKKVGVTKRTAGEFYLGQFLTRNALSLADVETVDLPPADIVAKIEGGEIDAALIFEPHVYGLNERMGNDIVIWSAQGDQRALGLAYSTKSFADEHPGTVERYVRALIEAERYVRENDRESQALVARTLGYTDAYVRHMWPKFDFEISLDQDLLLSMEAQARWSIANGLTGRPKVPNYLENIWFAALESVKPEASTIVH